MYLSLIVDYVNTINDKETPTIMSSLERVLLT